MWEKKSSGLKIYPKEAKKTADEEENNEKWEQRTVRWGPSQGLDVEVSVEVQTREAQRVYYDDAKEWHTISLQ